MRLAQATLDALGLGVVTSSAEGELRYANAVARRMVATGTTLTVEDGRLAASSPHDTERLRRVIRAAAERNPVPAALVFPSDGTSASAARTVVVPLALDRSDAGAALLLIGPRPSPAADIEDVLKVIHGFTAGEARVAHALLAGEPDVPGSLGLSPNTVATHVKRMFAKTRTRSRTHLVAMLMGGPAGVFALLRHTPANPRRREWLRTDPARAGRGRPRRRDR